MDIHLYGAHPTYGKRKTRDIIFTLVVDEFGIKQTEGRMHITCPVHYKIQCHHKIMGGNTIFRINP